MLGPAHRFRRREPSTWGALRLRDESALTHALAMSFAPEIRVNAIAPGWIATDAWKARHERAVPSLREVDHAQHPVGRVGRPEDVAALAAYLASSEASFITGQVFTIDGGMTRKMIYVE